MWDLKSSQESSQYYGKFIKKNHYQINVPMSSRL